MRILIFVLCLSSILQPCNSTEGRQSLFALITKSDIDFQLERLWQEAYTHEDNIAARAYDEFNALINGHDSVHGDIQVKAKLFQYNLADQDGTISEQIKEAWHTKEQTIERILSIKHIVSRESDSSNEGKDNEKENNSSKGR